MGLAHPVLAVHGQPAARVRRGPPDLATAAACPGEAPTLPWRDFLAPVAVTLAGGLVFYVLIVEPSYVLDGIGVTSTATIGLVSAIGPLATAVAAYLFARVARLGPTVTVPAAFTLSGLGILGLAVAPSVPVAVLGAVVAGLGSGLMLPALLTWALGNLTFAQRGRGTGIWTSAMFIGQFVCPLAILALAGATGGLSTALFVVGVATLLLAVAVRYRAGRQEAVHIRAPADQPVGP